MTIESQGVKDVYTGNGVATTWAYTFPIGAASDIHLYLRTSDGEPVEITTNFSVDEEAEQVTYPVDGDPLTSIHELTLIRETEITQELDLINGGPYDADVTEGGFDKLTRIMLEAREELDRCVKFPVSEDPTEEETSSLSYLADIEAFAVAAASSAASANVSKLAAAASAVTSAASAVDAQTAEANAEAAQAAAEAAAISVTKLPADLAVLKAAAVVGLPFIALATDLGQVVFFTGVAVGGSLGDGFEAI